MNHYIDTEPFRRIGAVLGLSGVETTFCYYMKDTPPGKMDISGMKRVPIFGSNRIKRGVLPKLLQLGIFIIDRHRIEAFFRREMPDLVVAGGDMTDHYGRLFFDAFQKLGIRVLLAPVTIPAPSFVNSDPDKRVPFAGAARFFLRLLHLEDTVFFRGWILGSYHKEAHIAVPTREVGQLLIENGIPAQRITVTGNPSHDRIHEMLSKEYSDLKSEVCTALQCPEDAPLIVYCTELIQDIHGMEYLQRVNRLLYEEFNRLSPDCTVVIKLHPRETAEAISLHRDVFKGGRYRIACDLDLLKLLRVAGLVIAHYTAALIDGALLGTTVLSIRLIDSPAIPVRFNEVSGYVHIVTKEEMGTKINAALFDPEFIGRQKDTLASWVKTSGYIIDGRNNIRTADLARKLVAAI